MNKNAIKNLTDDELIATGDPELVEQRANNLSAGYLAREHGLRAAHLYREAARLYTERIEQVKTQAVIHNLDAYRARRARDNAEWCERLVAEAGK